MSRILPRVRLANGLKYSVFFVAVLLVLPLAAFKGVPLYLMLGGLFVELEPWSVFWISLAFFAASWSLMSTTGLTTDGLEKRRPETGTGPYLPPAAARFLTMPITAGQLLLFSAVALAQTAIVVARSRSPALSALAGLGGAAAAYLAMAVLAAPTRLATGVAPIPRWWLVDAIWAALGPLKPLAGLLYRLCSRLFVALRLEAALETGSDTRRLHGGHFYAVTMVGGILALLAAVGWAFFPPAERFSAAPPAGAYLYVLLLLLIWVISGLDLHLSRFRTSAVLALAAIMALVYFVTDADHYYHAEPAGGAPPSLTPVEVAAASRAPENLVAVASAGGGILAAGWTTLVLRQAIAERPRLAEEIRLVSGVSGGSVGAAYYAHALRSVPDAARASPRLDEALAEAFRGSVSSSLDATAYGLAMLDFHRIFVGGSLPVLRSWDRGLLLEDSWERIAGDRPTLLDLRPDVRRGRVPALILNGTVMERGHRLMLTPIDFRGVGGVHAPTQTELLGDGDGVEVDVGLWTAARLSATFPYVSPAARSDLPATGGTGPDNRAYHVIDGGYYENFGVTSTLDFLWPVLAARLDAAGGLGFEKVLILRLDPFAPGPPPKPEKGLPSAVAGPLLALANLRHGTQITRNDADLERGLASWQDRFDRAGVDVCLATLAIRPPPEIPEGPLSWHLTPSQIEALEASWEAVVPQWEEVRSFLERPCLR